MEANNGGPHIQPAVHTTVVTHSPAGQTHLVPVGRISVDGVEKSVGLGALEIILRVICLVS